MAEAGDQFRLGKPGIYHPSCEGQPKPKVLDILKLLPRPTADCGEPTCMVFAVRLAEGVKGPESCTHSMPCAASVSNLFVQFNFEVV